MQLAEKPKFRGELKGEIHKKGFKTIVKFSSVIDTDPTRMSRIINGWEFPSTPMQEKIARALELSLNDLGKML